MKLPVRAGLGLPPRFLRERRDMTTDGSSDVTMVALKDHIGYAYGGVAATLRVSAGDTFTTTPARAERLIAKGMASKVVHVAMEAVGAPESDEEADVQGDAPSKVDGRTKAGRAAKKG